MEKQVGIITITDGCNYGNRLQNYALQTTLEELGVRAKTLRRRNFHDRSFVRQILHCAKTGVKILLGTDYNAPKRKRIKNFKAFNQKYINFSSDILANNKAPANLAQKYDFFVVGSDQVWNPMFRIIQEDMDNYFAAFAPAKKKFSYAASFGIYDIPQEYRDYYSRQLDTFSKISVREDRGVEIVKELSGKDARAVCDPTLLLNKQQWMSIMEKPLWLGENEKFIVTYFLGGMEEGIRESLSAFAAWESCRIINLESEFIRGKDIRNADSFAAPPQEFLWLFNNAQAVVTDSFHACVFSILFGKPFQVFERSTTEENNNMGSRIETLLGRYDMMERMGNSALDTLLLKKLPDEEAVELTLFEERKNGKSFLTECLGL